MLLLVVALLMMDGEFGDDASPPLESLGDQTTDILRIKRHRTMPHRGG